MACAGCAERRAKIKQFFGFGVGEDAGAVTPIAEVDTRITSMELSAPPPVKELLINYLSDSDNNSAHDILLAAAHLIVIALAKSCPDVECALERVDSACYLMRERLRTRADPATGKWREIIPVTNAVSPGKFAS